MLKITLKNSIVCLLTAFFIVTAANSANSQSTKPKKKSPPSKTSINAPGLKPKVTDDGWVSLFNGKNFDGWYTFLATAGKNNDPQKVFQLEKGVIHILNIPVTKEKQEFGYLASEKEFSHCRISLEFKWGTKRFPPREEDKRDSGLVYYFVGQDKIWPRGLENQIQETDVGDLWILDGTTISTKVETLNFPMYVLSGPIKTQSSGRIIKFGDFENRAGWNKVEVILDGDKVTHIINGTVVMRAWDLKQPDPKDLTQKIPLDSGRIFLQAEGSEIFYRNVRMKPL